MEPLIYFDNAATSFPKPRKVTAAVQNCIEEYCGNPGRSGHSLSLESAKAVYKCREQLATLFNLNAPENVVFTLNTTYALNMAVNALLDERDHVLISSIEHNSVYRPILHKGCRYDIFNSFAPRERVMADIASKLRPDTRMILCSHLSNISPIMNPIEEIGKLAGRRSILFVVDAAQSAGVQPIDMQKCNIDALCIPSHKGLYGIQGCGAVLFSSRFKNENAEALIPLVTGGNGVNSLEGTMPAYLPERLEAGTLPTPAIVGLSKGIEILTGVGIDHVREHEQTLYRRARELLGNNRSIRLYCREFARGQTLLFNVKGHSSNEITQKLNDEGVCVRGGFHCTPLCHKLLETGEGGAVRISFGAFNTLEEVDRFYGKLCDIIK